ncbi:hypothetical protein NEMIN01_2042 [Nematocida minor]|uniref:uncharacterized protein n=1 Tax=Nematocida minor TaxID=1912983 RepID=UPI002220245D|nr:uncharacterized protein NEMIN01_2042 [Nematocida minor]KAI5192478.1 hypothetical protein NEMIN01_2042 [Nematocida minor]
MNKGVQICSETSFKTHTETLIHEFTLVKQKSSKAPTSLIAEDVAGNKIVLCTLVPGVNESVVANMLLQAGESFILSTTTDDAIHISYLENENATEPSPSTSLVNIKIRDNEKVLVTGSTVYTLVSIVSAESKRLSVCLMINGEEVTLANLVPGRIETAEISLESYEDEELEIFLVGKGEVEMVGYVAAEETDEPDECSECNQIFEECECEESSEEINDDQFLSDDKMESIVGARAQEQKQKKKGKVTFEEENQEKHHETLGESKPKSKEERKKEEKERDLKELKIVDTFKSKNKQVAKKSDKVKIRYTLYVNNKMIDKNKSSGLVFKMGEGHMIRGLELAIEGMAVGSKRTITIPPRLGYGSTRAGGIPPNSVLVFLVELCAILN